MEIQIKTSLSSQPKKNKYQSINGQNEQNPLQQALNLIQALFKMRFIQKICRPIDKRIKQQYVQKFAGKMELLHHKLHKIQKECIQKIVSENQNKQNKYGAPKTKQSMQGSNTLKVTDWRKIIRNIEMRYIQVFQEGSFKFYKKVMLFNNFPYQLNTINIREWATSCIKQAETQKTYWCCC